MKQVLKITKGHATGNAFVIFSDAVGEIDLTDDECALLTDAQAGESADGVIRAVRSEHAPEGLALLETDYDAEWFMDHRYTDGSTAAVCGNALRVFVAFLMEEGLVDLTHGNRIAIGTRDGVKDVQVGSNGVFRVDLGRWRLKDDSAQVKMVLDSFTVEPFEPLVDDGIGRLSVHMNGHVTPATHSWATAAVAAALETRQRGGKGAPNNWRVDTPDGSIGVQMFPTEDGEHVSLSGPAEIGPETSVFL
jgi:diaminopimelate epimerase